MHRDATAATLLAGRHDVNVIRSTSADLLPLPPVTGAELDWSTCRCTCEALRAPALALSGLHFGAVSADLYGPRTEHHFRLAQAWIKYSKSMRERCARHANGNNW